MENGEQKHENPVSQTDIREESQTIQLLNLVARNNELLQDILVRVRRIERALRIGEEQSTEQNSIVDLTEDKEEKKSTFEPEPQIERPNKRSKRSPSIGQEDISSKEWIIYVRTEQVATPTSINVTFDKSVSHPSVERVKESIYSVIGIPPINQQLMLLDDSGHSSVSSHISKLKNGSFLLLTERKRNPFAILIKFANGKSLPLQVDEGDSIAELKQFVREKEGIPENNQRLFYSGRQLRDHEVLGTYKIHDGVTVHMFPRTSAHSKAEEIL